MWQDLLDSTLRGFRQLVRRVLNVLNWRLVRALGELQILTRASYVLLILVPLLAALWPAVKLAVNAEHRAIENASQVLHSGSAELDAATLRLRQAISTANANLDRTDKRVNVLGIEDLVGRIERMAKRIERAADQHVSDLDKKVLGEPTLPWTLAAAFFAALSVVLGHLIYQVYAPEQVRLMSWDTFVASRKDEYAKYPTDFALNRARRLIETRLGRRLKETDQYEAETILSRLFENHVEERRGTGDQDYDYLGREIDKMSKERIQSLVALIESGDAGMPHDFELGVLRVARARLDTSQSDPQYAQLMKITTVERGARAEYLHLAEKARPATLVTFVLYGMGVWLIALVIKTQALSVARAASLTSIADLFLH